MGDIATRLGGSVIRDYDRPQAFKNLKCWKCQAGRAADLVEPATPEQCIIKGVPAGAALCAECAFFSDEECEKAEQIDWEALAVEAAKMVEHEEDVRESMKENIRAWEREENAWGGA